ncbi:MAG: ABC transporter ATP-binding protein [Phycisphaerales bacterium]|nr:ABC transporter ATP-binding protein [Phycisphaerales bacterium]
MPSITLDHVVKSYGSVSALHDVSAVIADGARCALVGRSGAGKSTVLRVVAGLERPDSGRVLFDDRDVTHVAPSERGVAMVFQDLSLYPHMTVRANLAYPLKLRGVPREEREARVVETAKRMELSAVLDRRPGSISGGEQQRTALARALVIEAGVWLLDEPFGQLDTRLRRRLERLLLELHAATRATIMHVTHDQDEAERLADHIIVMTPGGIAQSGAPTELRRDDDGLWRE